MGAQRLTFLPPDKYQYQQLPVHFYGSTSYHYNRYHYDNFTHFLVGNENEPFCFGQNLSLRWVLED